ncbi:hypothetical protein QR46_3089 [Giardia duodenalis assemblage B]|uniref:Uncharacterized protein n=1 Tax=Giardia duodenalis assemblage B TaxID=1394984 RepID=A0A132NSD5_GIAIN|nr:hypothetical protein QR46_3089 [Giardia intestinalis assemblage B]
MDEQQGGIPEREKLINKEYKRRELQSFARIAGVRANSRNDELYEELLAWLDKQGGPTQVKTPQLTPILPQDAAAATGTISETPHESGLRGSVDNDEERVRTPVIHVPPKNDEPDVPYVQFAGKVAIMVSPSLPQSRFQDHIKASGLPVPMVNETSEMQRQQEAQQQEQEDKPANDSLFHVLETSNTSVSTPSIQQAQPINESSVMSQTYADSVAIKTTESLQKPNFNFSGMQTETLSWQASLNNATTLGLEDHHQVTRERQFEALKNLITEQFSNIRRRIKRQFDEQIHKFQRLAQVSLITVPPHLRAVSLQAILEGELPQSKQAVSESLIETLSKLKRAAIQ